MLLPKNDNFTTYLETKRKDRIAKLCSQFEQSKQSEVIMNTINLDQNEEERAEQ